MLFGCNELICCLLFVICHLDVNVMTNELIVVEFMCIFLLEDKAIDELSLFGCPTFLWFGLDGNLGGFEAKQGE